MEKRQRFRTTIRLAVLCACVSGLVAATVLLLGRDVLPHRKTADPRRSSAIDAPMRKLPESASHVDERGGRQAVSPGQAELQVKAVPTRVVVAQMGPEDTDRMASINRALVRAGIAVIPKSASIHADDLVAMREIVDEAEGRVAHADELFMSACVRATAPQRIELIGRLSRNEPAGVPEMGLGNPFKRGHPHEAITQVAYGDKFYVLRVAAWENEDVERSGSSLDVARARQFADYIAMVVPMFSN